MPWDRSSVSRCGAIAEAFGLSFYDATFLDVAQSTAGSVLLAQDEKLLKAAERALGRARAFDFDAAGVALRKGQL